MPYMVNRLTASQPQSTQRKDANGTALDDYLICDYLLVSAGTNQSPMVFQDKSRVIDYGL
jgi:hypothetical protein